MLKDYDSAIFFSCVCRYLMYNREKERELKMKSVLANSRFAIGDIVSWKSKSGNEYTGVVADIKQGSDDDLIVVQLANGEYRSFYDNATDWRMIHAPY